MKCVRISSDTEAERINVIINCVRIPHQDAAVMAQDRAARGKLMKKAQ